MIADDRSHRETHVVAVEAGRGHLIQQGLEGVEVVRIDDRHGDLARRAVAVEVEVAEPLRHSDAAEPCSDHHHVHARRAPGPGRSAGNDRARVLGHPRDRTFVPILTEAVGGRSAGSSSGMSRRGRVLSMMRRRRHRARSEAAGDRQADPAPGSEWTHRRSLIAGPAIEAFEDAFSLVVGNARPGVDHVDERHGPVAAAPQCHGPGRRSVAERIAQQIGQHLCQPIAVTTDRERRRRIPDVDDEGDVRVVELRPAAVRRR